MVGSNVIYRSQIFYSKQSDLLTALCIIAMRMWKLLAHWTLSFPCVWYVFDRSWSVDPYLSNKVLNKTNKQQQQQQQQKGGGGMGGKTPKT